MACADSPLVEDGGEDSLGVGDLLLEDAASGSGESFAAASLVAETFEAGGLERGESLGRCCPRRGGHSRLLTHLRVAARPARRHGPLVELDYVGSVENAAKVISTLHCGEKRLVFCDSRRTVEHLGAALHARGVTTFLSHASLSVEERRQAEQAFAEARDCVIVSTSTLELGIDVGDLDGAQIGA